MKLNWKRRIVTLSFYTMSTSLLPIISASVFSSISSSGELSVFAFKADYPGFSVPGSMDWAVSPINSPMGFSF